MSGIPPANKKQKREGKKEEEERTRVPTLFSLSTGALVSWAHPTTRSMIVRAMGPPLDPDMLARAMHWDKARRKPPNTRGRTQTPVRDFWGELVDWIAAELTPPELDDFKTGKLAGHAEFNKRQFKIQSFVHPCFNVYGTVPSENGVSYPVGGRSGPLASRLYAQRCGKVLRIDDELNQEVWAETEIPPEVVCCLDGPDRRMETLLTGPTEGPGEWHEPNRP